MKRATISEIKIIIQAEIHLYRQNSWCYAHLCLFDDDECDCVDCQLDEVA